MSKFSKLNVSGIYFIEDAGGIKIGSAKNIEIRRTDLQTANSYRLKILGYIECSKEKLLDEERIAHDYFAENKIHLEWFNKKIKKQLKEYIMGRKGLLIDEKNKKLDKNIIMTLYGEKPRTSLRPRCYFYPHLPAAIIGGRGTDEKYRKVSYKGKKVLVSSRKWEQLLNFKKDYREYLQNV
tara:strand:+ start:193 stop:735 length:543 start_codon:yes stop_codon:yes gene_type:complete